MIQGGGRFSFPVNLGADDVTYVMETSSDLETWLPTTGWQMVGEAALDGPFVLLHLVPSSAFQHEFLRVRAEKRTP